MIESKEKNREFVKEMDDKLKEIIKEIKKNYFVFLSSLKFENLADKKSERDYKISSPNPVECLQEDIETEELKTIARKKLNFEDEINIENKGLIAYIEIMNSIKRLHEFNEDLVFYLLKELPFPRPKQVDPSKIGFDFSNST